MVLPFPKPPKPSGMVVLKPVNEGGGGTLTMAWKVGRPQLECFSEGTLLIFSLFFVILKGGIQHDIVLEDQFGHF